MKKLSNITESVWSDIHSRSIGNDVRKEDNVDFITDKKDFKEYLKKHYEELDLDGDGLCTIECGNAVNTVSVPVFLNHDKEFSGRYYYLEINDFGEKGSYILLEYNIIKDFPDLYNLLEKRLKEENYVIKVLNNFNSGKPENLDISPKDNGEIKNSFFLEILDLLLDNSMSPLENMIRKIDINESIWSDIHSRSVGNDVRKEDDITNIRDIKPVDMGVSVLWADRDLKWKNADWYFEFDEVNEIIKNTDWRIPTKNEALELFTNTRNIKNTNEVCILKGDSDHGSELIFEKIGLKYADSNTVTNDDRYCSWTSTQTSTQETYYMNSIKQFQYFAPMHSKNKICVRLVKDKK